MQPTLIMAKINDILLRLTSNVSIEPYRQCIANNVPAYNYNYDYDLLLISTLISAFELCISNLYTSINTRTNVCTTTGLHHLRLTEYILN